MTAHVHDESCQPPQGALLCIIPGPTEVIAEHDAGVRWCFNCRAHLAHTDRLLADKEPSYYEPVWARQCSRCGHDHTAFPGSVW